MMKLSFTAARVRAILIALAFMFGSSALKADSFGPYNADLIRVVDGDTVELAIHIFPGLNQVTKIRLIGVNTPEKRTRLACEKLAGIAATEFTQAALSNATITVTNIKNGKFAGRHLGSIMVDGNDLSELLISSGHGRQYGGGKREPWC